MLQFKIEQIAIRPKDPVAAKFLLEEMGAVDWIQDKVSASGTIFGGANFNDANLQFNYQMSPEKTQEFEILNYLPKNKLQAEDDEFRCPNCDRPDNWIDFYGDDSIVSHLGMHCTQDELYKWREFFLKRHISVAQEVFTTNHKNEAIAGKRYYNYVIFSTREILGVDLKFIVRIDA